MSSKIALRGAYSYSMIGLCVALLGCSGSSSGDDSASGARSNGGGSAGVGGTSVAAGGSAGAAGGATGALAGDGGASAGSGALGSAGTGGASASFQHPGVLVNRAMLDFVKGKIAAKEAPWSKALSTAQNDGTYGKASASPTPFANVVCYPSSGDGSVGCAEEKRDADAAYTQALLWYYTGTQSYATKAMQIMDAWSSTITQHTQDNQQLQSAWVAEVFTRAAEIIRYTGAGWSADKVQQFTDMLNNAYLPYIKDFSTRTGNWDASTIEAVMNIAVFEDDMPMFQGAVARWRQRVPAWAYLSSDGATPAQPPGVSALSASAMKNYWINPTAYVDGLGQETCKDLAGTGTQGIGHEQYGLAALINAAETARIQGLDLFSEEEKRLVTTLEFHAQLLNGASVSGLCDSAINAVSPDPMWEIAYNAYANVLGQALPETLKVVNANSPTGADHHMVWETLTHHGVGNAGL